MPYWVGPNQKFVNLVSSEAWKTEVNSRVEAKGFTPMFYFCIDPRTISIRHGVEGPIQTPADMQGLKVRLRGYKNRTAARSVGDEGGRTCRSRWSARHIKNKKQK